MEIRYCTTPGCECPIPPYREHCESCYIPTPAERLAAVSNEDFNKYATRPLRMPVSYAPIIGDNGYLLGTKHIEWMEKQPKTLDFNGARCGLAQLSHIAVLLETHGTLLIRNCMKCDDPGSMLLAQGMQLADARSLKRELDMRPDGR